MRVKYRGLALGWAPEQAWLTVPRVSFPVGSSLSSVCAAFVVYQSTFATGKFLILRLGGHGVDILITFITFLSRLSNSTVNSFNDLFVLVYMGGSKWFKKVVDKPDWRCNTR